MMGAIISQLYLLSTFWDNNFCWTWRALWPRAGVWSRRHSPPCKGQQHTWLRRLHM